MKCSIESILAGKGCSPEPARKAKANPALEAREIAKVPILSASMVAFINAKRSLIDGITVPDSELKAYGLLCEKFETGGIGPSKINKDDQGMPAMGSYQIRGEKLRDICYMLSIEGDYRLTSSNSSLFTNWIRKIGGMGEDQFGKFERRFVYIYYFLPQINRISKYVNPKSFSLKMNQVIWSTVMQHGENIGFIEQALLEAKVGPSTKWTQKIEDVVIERIYDLRMKRGLALRESSIKRFTLKYKTRPVLGRVGPSQSPDERLLFPDLKPRYIAEKEKVLPHPTIGTQRKKV